MSAFRFENLDAETRNLMLGEIDFSISHQRLYISHRFTLAGVQIWPDLLREACRTGNEISLEVSLGSPGGPYLVPVETTTLGTQKVPIDAARVLAGSEFNRFYIRALCKRAIDNNLNLEIYLSRQSARPDPNSEAKIGERVDCFSVLNYLRTNQGVATTFGLPSHPNSGLSVRIVAG